MQLAFLILIKKSFCRNSSIRIHLKKMILQLSYIFLPEILSEQSIVHPFRIKDVGLNTLHIPK